MPIFGDISTFAISVHPVPGEDRLIHCNLILGGEMIGNPESFDMLGTCVGDIKRLSKRISENRGHFRDTLFDGLNDNEIIELIYKSNQLEEEYNPVFSYLPTMPTNDLWYKHTVDLAETTDQYAIVVLEESNELKFLWQKWEDRDKSLRLRNVIVKYDRLCSAIKDFLNFIESEIPITLKKD